MMAFFDLKNNKKIYTVECGLTTYDEFAVYHLFCISEILMNQIKNKKKIVFTVENMNAEDGIAYNDTTALNQLRYDHLSEKKFDFHSILNLYILYKGQKTLQKTHSELKHSNVKSNEIEPLPSTSTSSPPSGHRHRSIQKTSEKQALLDAVKTREDVADLTKKLKVF